MLRIEGRRGVPLDDVELEGVTLREVGKLHGAEGGAVAHVLQPVHHRAVVVVVLLREVAE